MEKKHKLVIIGDSAFAEIAYEYFTHDSEYEVVAFAVEQDYLKRETLFGVPVVALETLESNFAPAEHYFYAANVYTQGNKLRERLYRQAKEKGYRAASYISSKAFVWRNVELGEHCFVFENNVIQPFVKIGNDVVLWSGNHIGHHSIIKDHCFISSHVVVSGFCQIGTHCFMGVNATVGNNINIGDNCLVGAAATIVGDVEDNQKVVGLWKKRPASS
jgi:sugar O-acyltransferase (sialic acid O-acetyltransferase NeuD family)